MWQKRWNSPCRRIPTNSCRYFTLKEGEQNPILQKWSEWYWLQGGGVRGVTVQWRHLTVTAWASRSRPASTVTNHVGGIYSWYYIMKMTFHLPSFIIRKQQINSNSGAFYWIAQYFKKMLRSSNLKEIWRNLPQSSRAQGDKTTKYNVLS